MSLPEDSTTVLLTKLIELVEKRKSAVSISITVESDRRPTPCYVYGDKVPSPLIINQHTVHQREAARAYREEELAEMAKNYKGSGYRFGPNSCPDAFESIEEAAGTYQLTPSELKKWFE